MKLGDNTVEETWEAVMDPKVYEHIAPGREYSRKKTFIYQRIMEFHSGLGGKRT